VVCDIRPEDCVFGSKIFYGPWTFLNTSRTDVYFAYEPFPTSAKNIIHWAQAIKSGKIPNVEAQRGGKGKYGGSSWYLGGYDDMNRVISCVSSHSFFSPNAEFPLVVKIFLKL
jgi:hypothetical protein